MSQGSAMSNPYEYRELMCAQFHMGTETRSVDQVLAEQKRRHDARTPARKAAAGGKRAVRAAPPSGTVRQDQLDAMMAMLNRNKQVES